MWLDDVAAYLISEGVVNAPGDGPWPIYEGFMPDDPGQDQVVAIFTTGGHPADTLARENRDLTMMLRVRASKLNFAVAYSQYQAIFAVLQDAQQVPGSPVLLPGFIFMQALQVDPLQFNDEHSRTNLTSNWRVKIQVIGY